MDVNKKIIQEFAILRGRLRSKGKLIDNFDLLIAATCLSYNLVLATNNKSHFTRIPKLEIIKPRHLLAIALEKETAYIPLVNKETEKRIGKSLEALEKGKYIEIKDDKVLGKVLGIK